MSLIFDTETTGLPDFKGLEYGKYPDFRDLKRYDSSRLLSICWMLLDNNRVVSCNYALITPSGFNIDEKSRAFEINGISNEEIAKYGEDFEAVMRRFLLDLDKADVIVAHNLRFDKNILASEMVRNGDDCSRLLQKEEFCTMLKGSELYNYRHSLKELYCKFFNREFSEAHNALADVIACMKCYKEMLKSNLIS